MNATTISIDTSHASYVAHPDEIADLILDAAKASTIGLEKAVQWDRGW
jgi:hypothetical protein